MAEDKAIAEAELDRLEARKTAIMEEQRKKKPLFAALQQKPVQPPVVEENKEAQKPKVRAPKNNNTAMKRIMEALDEPELLEGPEPRPSDQAAKYGNTKPMVKP